VPRRVSRLLALALAAAGCDVVTPPPRDGIYSFDLYQTGLVFHWPIDRLPIRYWVNPTAGPVARYVETGLRAWEAQFVYGEFAGLVVSDSARADVLVAVAGPTPPDVPLTDAPPVDACSGETYNEAPPGVDTLAGPFEVTLHWAPQFADADVANCLLRVTVHEVGHTIGLLAHSPDPADLMYTDPKVGTPSGNDRATAQTLYHTTPDLAPPRRPQ
jgi:hypothetical protein